MINGPLPSIEEQEQHIIDCQKNLDIKVKNNRSYREQTYAKWLLEKHTKILEKMIRMKGYNASTD